MADRSATALQEFEFELRFRSVADAGRGYSFPCDADGQVPLADLTDRLRNNYFYARAVVGNELLWPTVSARPMRQ